MKVAIVVFVVGPHCSATFNRVFRPSLAQYCIKHSYDLIIQDRMIHDDGENVGTTIGNKKKFYWQRLLIPHKFSEYDFVVSLDSDIFVGPNAPPLPFDQIPAEKVAAVNERKFLENYEWREYIQTKQKYEKTGKDYHALSGEIRDYHDHINGGLVIYQPKHHGFLFRALYHTHIGDYMKYHQDDQSFLSLFLIDNDMIYWLDQRYNRIWAFWRDLFYPNFRTLDPRQKHEYVANCIRLNYFTHFTSMEDVNSIYPPNW
jgi:hypothetical protein